MPSASLETSSPKMAKERPASFFFSPILCSLNLMEAARQAAF